MKVFETKEEIAEKIRGIRGKLTQEEFGKRVSIHKNQISRYERGLARPRRNQLKKIEEYAIGKSAEAESNLVSDVHPDYLRGPKSGDYRFGLKAIGEDGTIQVLPKFLKKFLDNIIEILNSDKGDVLRVVIEILNSDTGDVFGALSANVKVFIKAVRLSKKNNKKRGSD